MWKVYQKRLHHGKTKDGFHWLANHVPVPEISKSVKIHDKTDESTSEWLKINTGGISFLE